MSEFFAIISPGQRRKGRTAITIRKELLHKRLATKTTLQVITLEVYVAWIEKRTIGSVYLLPNRPCQGGRYEGSVPAPTTLY